MMLFFLLLTLGFVYELGTKALLIDSRQNDMGYLYLNSSSDSNNTVLRKVG
jgi:hypothetical protein